MTFQSMQRHWWQRALAPLLAVWFLVLTTEPSALHVCEMHGAAHGASVLGDGDAKAAHHAAPSDASHGSPTSDEATCTCLGVCCSASPVSIAPVKLAQIAIVTATEVRPGRPQHEWVAGWVDFVLPFSTAPPSLLG
jgi:hypothetical protein